MMMMMFITISGDDYFFAVRWVQLEFFWHRSLKAHSTAALARQGASDAAWLH